jgi:hypothetical protein
MDRQTTMTPTPTDHRQAAGSTKILARDLTRLLDLQWRLIRVDVYEFGTYAARPGIAVGIGGVTLFAAQLLGLMGIAHLIAEQTGLSLGSALLTTAAAAGVLATITLVIGVQHLTQASQILVRSRDDLASNMHSIVEALHPHNENSPGVND